MRKFGIFFILLALCSCAGRSIGLEEVGRALASADPGDTLFVRDGVWRDANLHWEGQGDAANPVVVAAEHPG